MRKNEPYEPYARCALGCPPSDAVHIYLRTDRFEFRRRIRYQDYRARWAGEEEHLAFRVLFMEFEFLVTPRPLSHLRQSLVDIDPDTGGEWWERPTRVAQPHEEAGVDGSVLYIRWPE